MKNLAYALCVLALATATPVQAEDAPQNLVLYEAPKAAPDLRFEDAAGKPVRLADFRGRVVVLNLWATWCIPCRKEMPTLDRLQAKLGGADFQVVTVSIDRGGLKAVDPFFHEIGIAHLTKYLDASGEVAGHAGVFGLPTTLLVDRDGRELGRLVGPAEWDRADMIEFVRKIIARKQAS
jgi:thiol-disulfide isomerase/thioredoxin